MQRTLTQYVCLGIACALALRAEERKTIQTQAEFALYDAVVKDFGANNFAKALTDLDLWQQKYPSSDVNDVRQFLYVQAYFSSSQPAKALEAAAPLFEQDLTKVLDNPADVARLLYSVSAAIQQIPAPNASQLELGEKAARKLETFDQMPEGVKADDWAKTREGLRATAQAALRHVALSPAALALAKKDCAAAEAAARKALASYPESAQAAWYLGSAAQCLYSKDPGKALLMLYEFARAASLDPVKGAIDPQWQKSTAQAHLKKLYEQYHGEDAEGFKKLRELAVQTPLPPEGFAVKSKTEIEADQRAQFDREHPELALWLRIKRALQSGGETYFESELKDAAVPRLNGVLVEAKPACHPTELRIAVPTPDDPTAAAEIVLKLDKPLAGKLPPKSELSWEGVPVQFSKDPLLLTMEAEAAKLTGAAPEACQATSPKKATPSKR